MEGHLGLPWETGVQFHLQNPTGVKAGLVDGVGHQHLQRAGTIVTSDLLGGLLSCGERGNGDVCQSSDIPACPLGGDCGGHMYGCSLVEMETRRCGNMGRSPDDAGISGTSLALPAHVPGGGHVGNCNVQLQKGEPVGALIVPSKGTKEENQMPARAKPNKRDD